MGVFATVTPLRSNLVNKCTLLNPTYSRFFVGVILYAAGLIFDRITQGSYSETTPPKNLKNLYVKSSGQNVSHLVSIILYFYIFEIYWKSPLNSFKKYSISQQNNL